MTVGEPQTASKPGPIGLWLPGALLGTGVVALAVLATDLVPDAARGPALAGAGAAALLGFPGVFLKLRAARQPIDDGGRSPLTGGVAAVQVAVLADFLLNAVAIGAGLVGMWLSGMKFELTAGFGLAYATVALAIQVLSGVGLARTLRSPAVSLGGPVGGPGPAYPDASESEASASEASASEPSASEPSELEGKGRVAGKVAHRTDVIDSSSSPLGSGGSATSDPASST